jgi:hypothetical protein
MGWCLENGPRRLYSDPFPLTIWAHLFPHCLAYQTEQITFYLMGESFEEKHFTVFFNICRVGVIFISPVLEAGLERAVTKDLL